MSDREKLEGILSRYGIMLGHDLIVPKWVADKLREAGVNDGFTEYKPIPLYPMVL